MAEHALPQSEPDEAQLIERARQNDCAAILSIIKQQNRRLYHIARSIVRDDIEAEDALQEAYVRALSNLDSFRGGARLGTWLARIVINEALTCLRRRRPAMDIDLLAERPRSERSDYFLSLCQSRTRSRNDHGPTRNPHATRARHRQASGGVPRSRGRAIGRGHGRRGDGGVVRHLAANGEDASASRSRTPET